MPSTVSRAAVAFSLALLVGCTSAQPVLPSPTGGPLTAPGPSLPAPSQRPTADDERIVRALVEFARRPDPSAFAAVPFADTVRLGLGDRLRTERASRDLVRPEEWVIMVDHFRGYVGPFSALDLLARDAPTTISVGPHPHCASPPVPPPTGLVTSRRVSIQAKDVDTCLRWWTVDLFISASGRIEAVTLDLWEP